MWRDKNRNWTELDRIRIGASAASWGNVGVCDRWWTWSSILWPLALEFCGHLLLLAGNKYIGGASPSRLSRYDT